MEILTKNFLVYGSKLSGESAVNFLLEKGAFNVYVYDDNKIENFDNTQIVENFEDVIKLNLECVVLSPGVNILGNKNIEFLKKHNIPYYSEFYVGFMFSRGTKVCITGTNGKTTTVNLIYKMCSKKYKNIFLCGNTDTPITQIANKTTNKSLLVCEVSSFALESVEQDFCPNISSILNVSVDHISRHKSFENYKKIKENITKYQKNDCFFVCNDNFLIKTDAKVLTYSTNKNSNLFLKNNCVYYKNKKVFNTKIVKLVGKYNLENVMCATLISKLLNVKNWQIKSAIKNFVPLSHRLQKVYYKNQITYIDDSKATNPDSTICALESFNTSLILLLGGSDKGYEYDQIFEHTKNVKQVVCFGQMAEKIKNCALKYNVMVSSFSSLKEAIVFSIEIAKSGDTILLSPACASFDEFSSYKQRGEYFLKIVKECNEKN